MPTDEQIREALEVSLDVYAAISEPALSDTEALVRSAARMVVEGESIRYCFWHERRAADDVGEVITKHCSSQDGSSACVIGDATLIRREI